MSPFFKMEVSIWLDCESHVQSQSIGVFLPWNISGCCCEYISHGPGRHSYAFSACFFQVKPQLFIKVFTEILLMNQVSVRVQPILIIPNLKYSMLEYLALKKVHWFLAKSFTISLKSINDAQCFFIAGLVRIISVYLALLSISNLDVISRCSNTPTVIYNIAMTTAGTS